MCLLFALAVLCCSAPGWFMLTGNDDVHVLISRPPDLLAQEAKIRQLTGFGNSSQFFLVEGATPEAVLVNEERLSVRLAQLTAQDQLSGFQSLSAFVPSAARQTENRALWQARVFAEAYNLKQLLSTAGLRDGIAEQLRAEFESSAGDRLLLDEWLAAPVSLPFRYLWLGPVDSGFASVVQPQGVRDAARLEAETAGLAGVTFVDKAGSVSRLFHDYRQWGGLWLFGAICLVYIVLSLRYGLRQAACVLLPTVLSMSLSLAVFGYLAMPLTLFNLMGLMLVLGVGVNYAIFLREGGVRAAATLAGVLLSAGTTLLSFGLLAFSSMPALSGFGLTLLLGIGLAVVLAPMTLTFKPGALA